jgi:hypothetical protein
MKVVGLLLRLIPLVALCSAWGCTRLHFAAGVSGQDRSEIERGLEWTRSYLNDELGGAPKGPLSITAHASEGACGESVAYASGHSICINTNHPVWDQFTDQHEKITAHEYIHVLQSEIGCVNALPAWLVEGAAEYFAYRVIIEAGLTTRDAVHAYHAAGVATLPMPVLEDVEATARTDTPGIYSLFYLATERLIEASEPLAYRRFCEAVAADQGWRSAFQESFGVSVASFYEASQGHR